MARYAYVGVPVTGCLDYIGDVAECFAQAQGHYRLLNNLGLFMTFIDNINCMLAYCFI